MATKPTPGGSDGTWGTELNAHLDVSLDADGKVDDGAAQTTSAAPGADAELSNKKYTDDQDAADHPAYTGGESHTDGSGLIMKMGTVAAATGATVTFGAAFPNAIVSVIATLTVTSTTLSVNVESISTSSFKVYHNSGGSTTVQWVAIGH